MFVYRGHDVATVVVSHLVCSVRSCSCLLTLSHVNHVCEQDEVLNVNYLVATLKQTMRRGRPSSKRARDEQTPHTASQLVDQLSGLSVEALTGKGASRRKRSKKSNKSKRSTVTVSGRQNIGKFLLKFFRKKVSRTIHRRDGTRARWSMSNATRVVNCVIKQRTTQGGVNTWRMCPRKFLSRH